MAKCEKCGKYCKNLKGLKIHNYHKHREFQEINESSEITFLKMEIKMIKRQLQQLRINGKSVNSNNTNWNVVKKIPKIENNLNTNNFVKVVSELTKVFELDNFGLVKVFA